MPPRDKKAALQFLHIPKTGTSFNYLLHDYFDCLVMENNTDGCSEWLDVPSRQQRGLCGGRLYSCQGHRTHRDLPQRVRLYDARFCQSMAVSCIDVNIYLYRCFDLVIRTSSR